MKPFLKHSLLSVAALTVAAPVAAAELSANVGVASNYLWRGVTQSGDDAAISGGLDVGFGPGFYAGTWTSSLGDNTSNYELDLYGGFAAEAGPVSYDVGVIHYAYPVGDVELDFTEVYGSLGFSLFTATLAYTVDTEADVADDNDLYASLAADVPIRDDLSVGVLVGNYDFDAPAAEDYTHYQVSLTKSTGEFGDFTFAVDQNDLEDTGAGEDDPRVWVSWSKGFDL